MKRLLLLLSCCLSLALLQAQSTVTDNFNWDGTNRSYRLRVPPAASSGDLLPLVINMHGFAGSASGHESSTGMNIVADSAGFFTVYPNGTFTFLFLRGWATEISGPAVDDIGFISALIDTLVAEYPIDPTKVYACGFSNGGGMTSTLACELSDKIYAFGINAAAILPSNGPLCNPTTVRPMLSFHGTSDFIVPYGGSSTLAPAEGFFKFWVNQETCNDPVIDAFPDIASDGTLVFRARFDDCASGNKHWFYRIQNGDHTWPGSPGATQQIDADAELWEFFKENGADARTGRTISVEKLNITPNPASNYTLLQGLSGNWEVQVIDLAGKTWMADQGADLATHIDLSEIPNGIYILNVVDDLGSRSSQFVVQK
jgi:polyhydroxybutyrate depolymerase